MNWRKHMVLMVGGGLSGLLLIASLVLLVHFQREFGTVSRDLDAARTRLQQLTQRNPFPSVKNVEVTSQNLEQVKAMALDLQGMLQQAQIIGEAMEPAEFAPLLERTIRQLNQRAQEAGVIFPEGFAFGFARYTAGELPLQADVPRLVAQLRCVEALCGVLFQARVARIDTLNRELFDSATEVAGQAAVTTRSRTRVVDPVAAPVTVPPVVSNELFGAERLVVSFQARETAAWDVLNGLARNPVFMAVADLDLENVLAASGQLGKKTALTPISGGDKAASSGLVLPLQFAARDDRVVGGREWISVGLVVDVYRFNSVFQKEAAP